MVDKETKKVGFFDLVPKPLVASMRAAAEDRFGLGGRLDRISIDREVTADDVIAFYEERLTGLQKTNYLARDLNYPAVFDEHKAVLQVELEKAMELKDGTVHPNVWRTIKALDYILGVER